MATKTKSTLVFRDVVGKTAKVNVTAVGDLTKAKALATALASWTFAEVSAVSFTETDKAQIGTSASGQFDSVNFKADLYFEDKDTGQYVGLELPCPLVSITEHTTGNQYTIKKSSGDQIAVDLKTATGRDLRFIRGRVIGNITEGQ